jgi:hypothetical protein
MSADEERGKLLAAVANLQLNDRRQNEAIERIEVRLDSLADDFRKSVLQGFRKATPTLAAAGGVGLVIAEAFRAIVLPLLTGHH